jgi:uncharacterized repeat protein (TIGR03803 family)
MGFTNLHSFTPTGYETSTGNYTNSDGDYPQAELLLSGNVLYGTASQGGLGNGTVFAVNTDGTGFTTLHKFTVPSGSNPGFTNSDGGYPVAGLILFSNTLYGTSRFGGISGKGTVFSISLPPPPPALGISTYSSQPALFFPTATGTNYVLQMTTNLASGNWLTVSNGIPISGLIITNPPANAFFRLH